MYAIDVQELSCYVTRAYCICILNEIKYTLYIESTMPELESQSEEAPTSSSNQRDDILLFSVPSIFGLSATISWLSVFDRYLIL